MWDVRVLCAVFYVKRLLGCVCGEGVRRFVGLYYFCYFSDGFEAFCHRE